MKKTCFVVMGYGKKTDYKIGRSIDLDKTYNNILKPLIEELGMECVRSDEIIHSGIIDKPMFNQLISADIVIADISTYNPNAFYEIGYRSALKKPIIHLKSKETSIPFDISSIRTFDYDLTDLDAVTELKQRLNKTIATFNFDSSINENNEKSDNDYINSQVLQELFKIHDGIEEIKKQISNNRSDTAAVSVLADKLADTNKISIENTMATLVLKEIFNDPSKLHTITSAMKQLESIK